MSNPYEPNQNPHYVVPEVQSAREGLADRVRLLGGTDDEADAVLVHLDETEARAAMGMSDVQLRVELLGNRREYVHGTEPDDAKATAEVRALLADEAAMVITGSIKQVTAWVGQPQPDLAKARAALDAERARGDEARKGLLTFLEGLVGADPD